MRPFRFLAPVGDAPDLATLTATARRAEAIGIDVLITPDHLLPQHAPLPLLTAVAAVTERLRVGTFVLNVDLRHPAVLAQELATLSVLSGGRLEVGIGAGWNKPEYDAIGLVQDPLPTRVARLAEALDVIEGCFGPGPFSYAGQHFTIRDHDGHPKPAATPRIFLGGGGKRALTLAATRADTVGLAPRPGDPFSYTAAGTEQKVGWVREAAGERFAELELNAYPSGGPVVVTGDARAAAEPRARQLGLGVEEVLESPHVFIGTVAALADKCRELRDRYGITSIMLDDLDAAEAIIQRLR
jgi:probable F420-dependent oxidoreductase